MKLKKILALIMSALCITSVGAMLCITAGASGIPFSLTVQRRLSSGSFENTTEALQDDMLKLCVSMNNTTALSSMRLRVTYDKTAVTPVANSVECLISDPSGEFTANLNEDKSRITAMWDTVSMNTKPNGTVFTFLFSVNDVSSQMSAVFGLSVEEIYNSSNGAESAEVTAPSVTVLINPQTFTAEELAVFEKLAVIKYPDSKADIDEAKTLFASFSATKVKAFYAKYPELYEYYRTASTRYNELQEQASYAEIDKAIENFLTKYSRILSLDKSKVTLDDKSDIKSAAGELDAMSPTVLSRMDDSVKTHIKELSSVLNELEKIAKEQTKAAAEYQEFLENFDYVLSLDENAVASNFEDIAPLISEAVTSFEFMSDLAQQMGEKEKLQLNELAALVEKYSKEHEETAALLEEQQAFLKKWSAISALSPSTVSLGDETAIKMMLSEIEAMPEELQATLAMRKSMLQRLLDKIETLKEDSNEASGSGSVTQIVESTDSVSTVTSTSSSSSQSSANNAATAVVIDDSKQTDSIIQSISGSTPKIILVLCILLGVSVLTLIFPGILGYGYFKKSKQALSADWEG